MEEFQCKVIFIALLWWQNPATFSSKVSKRQKWNKKQWKESCFDINLDSTLQFLFIVRVGAFPTLWLTLKVSHVMFLLSTLPVLIWFRPPTLFLVLWQIISVLSGWGVARWPGISLGWRPSFWGCIYRSYLLASWGSASFRWSLLPVSVLRIIGRTWWWWLCLFFFPFI